MPKLVVFFNILLKTRQKEWIVEKRFSQFDALHKVLSALYPTLPQLPPKTVLKVSSPVSIIRRKLALSGYLKELVERPEILNNPVMLEFLEVRTDFTVVA